MRRTLTHLLSLALLASLAFPLAAQPTPVSAAAPSLWSANLTVEAVAASDSTIYIGGFFTYVGQEAIGFAKLDGATAKPKPGLPHLDGAATAIVSDGAGGWFIGGLFRTVGSAPRKGLAHIRADGTPDPNWRADLGIDDLGNATVDALVLADGTLYVGGNFLTVAGQPRTNLAAIDAATGALRSWNPTLSGTPVKAIAAGDGRVYAGGPGLLTAFDASTAAVAPGWESLVTSGDVEALLLSGQTLYAGGSFGTINGTTPTGRAGLAALDTATAQPTAWNPGGVAVGVWLQDMVIRGSTMYVSGFFSTFGANGQPRAGLAAVDLATGNATDWSPAGSAGLGSYGPIALSANRAYVLNRSSSQFEAYDLASGATTSWRTKADGWATEMIVDGSDVIAVGGFTLLGGGPRNGLAALSRATGELLPFDPMAPDDEFGGAYHVNSLLLDGDTLYVGGKFALLGTQSPRPARANLAALDASTGEALAWNPNSNGQVRSLLKRGSTVYVGGPFTQVGGEARTALAAIDATTGTATAWYPKVSGAPLGSSPEVTALAISPDGATLYAGGLFSGAGAQSPQPARRSLVALSTSTAEALPWNPAPADGYLPTEFGPQPAFATVRSLILRGATLYVGGLFSALGSQSPQPARQGLAAVDALTGQVTPWNPAPTQFFGSPTPQNIASIQHLAAEGGSLYVVGTFTAIGAQSPQLTQSSYAALDIITGQALDWQPFAGVAEGPRMMASFLAALPEGVIFSGMVTPLPGSSTPWSTLRLLPLAPQTSLAPTPSGTPSGTPSPNGAELTASFDTGGLPTSVVFQLTTTSGDYTNPLVIPAAQAQAAKDIARYTAAASGLASDTTYYWRAVATSAGGSAATSEQSFATPPHQVFLPITGRS